MDLADSLNLVSRQKLRDQVVDRICQLIADKRLLSGQAMPTEKGLQKEFGVSHTVIREALGVLESRGIIEVRHGVGAFVNAPEDWDVAGPIGFLVGSDRKALLEWLEIRMALEVEAAGLAAQRASDEDLDTLASAASGVAEAGEDYEAAIQADLGFHLQLARAANNATLAKVIKASLLPLPRSLARTAALPGSLRIAMSEHDEIRHHVARRDPDGARAAMRRHLVRVGTEIEQILR
ncbi:MAG: FadR/GntR family transcriptional regulator [Chloroflexota bacterium]